LQGEPVIKGEAKDEREKFEFSIEPFVAGGFMLSIRFNGDGRENITGAGVWPSVEKAKEIAQTTATKLLHGAMITWQENSEQTAFGGSQYA
jgi:hypothetical protein